jgi:predicted KAP-like P-loop ATPase
MQSRPNGLRRHMITNDTAINTPEEDQFGVSPFAQAIANSIEKIAAPEGTVIALTGEWGCGKSSVVNLVRHYLKGAEEAERLKIIAFNPWWYQNEDAATRGFFQSLYVVLGKKVPENARKIVLSLSKKLLSSGTLIAAAVDLVTFGYGGKIAETAAGAAAEMIKTDRTAEQDYQLLAKELRKQTTKFLVVIDDIDRLTPDQALVIFRLVKSVGRLPNVIYLLAFDRRLAERVIEQRHPADQHFLEKIVQASFEVPTPDAATLHGALLAGVVSMARHPDGEEGVRFRDILADVVNPLIRLPRDLVRFMGSISVSYAAIGEEVNLAYLVATEALRLFRFPVHQAIQANRGMLCGTGSGHGRTGDLRTLYDAIFLETAKTDREREHLRTALRRLFPRLDSVWGNLHYDPSTERRPTSLRLRPFSTRSSRTPSSATRDMTRTPSSRSSSNAGSRPSFHRKPIARNRERPTSPSTASAISSSASSTP